jgi:hypothetical protein
MSWPFRISFVLKTSVALKKQQLSERKRWARPEHYEQTITIKTEKAVSQKANDLS